MIRDDEMATGTKVDTAPRGVFVFKIRCTAATDLCTVA